MCVTEPTTPEANMTHTTMTTKAAMKRYDAAVEKLNEDWYSGRIRDHAEYLRLRDALKRKAGGEKAIQQRIMRDHLDDSYRRIERQRRDQARI